MITFEVPRYLCFFPSFSSFFFPFLGKGPQWRIMDGFRNVRLIMSTSQLPSSPAKPDSVSLSLSLSFEESRATRKALIEEIPEGLRSHSPFFLVGIDRISRLVVWLRLSWCFARGRARINTDTLIWQAVKYNVHKKIFYFIEKSSRIWFHSRGILLY